GVAVADSLRGRHRAVLLRASANAQASPWTGSVTPHVLETERLVLRRLTVDDHAFIFELLNDPAWLRFIGDKGVRTHEDARDYIRKGPMAMYERVGWGC